MDPHDVEAISRALKNVSESCKSYYMPALNQMGGSNKEIAPPREIIEAGLAIAAAINKLFNEEKK